MTQTQKSELAQKFEPVGKIVYAYTQHQRTVDVIETTCNINIIRLKQDRTKDPVEDILSQIVVPYAVVAMPDLSKNEFVESCKQKGARIWLMQLRGKFLAVADIPPENDTYEYTALPEELARQVVEKVPWVPRKTLELGDRPITVIGGYVPIILYVVLPIDKVVELKQMAPWLQVRLMQLDGKIVEKLTGRPYDPKTEYPVEIVAQALKVIEVKGGYIRYLRSVEDFFCEVDGKTVAIFNDTLREALVRLNKRATVKFVKTCDSNDCVEVNPLGYKSGYRISFPGTAGRLTPEQMAEIIERGEARIYYAEVRAQEVSLC
jgi:hypothetical protein